MEWVAKRLTNYILAKQVISEESRAAYEYGFQTGLEQSICILVTIVAAMCMNRVWECVLLLVVFFLQRAYVKGIHMKQYWSCFLLSCGVVIAGLYGCGRVAVSGEMEIIIALVCLLLVQLASRRFGMQEDEAAVRFFEKQRKRIAWLVALSIVVLYVMQWENGLFVVCYTELVMLVSTVAQLIKEKLGNRKNG
ncbi:MAG: accessory gene regulator B family protein [Lachnospiraceae bacterium]|nr:accessory gene regulator B family protein [Lachnospiraceae bacterium]